MFGIEKAILEAGLGGAAALVHDPEADVFRFPDGRFAPSRKHADWRALKEAGYFSEWGCRGHNRGRGCPNGSPGLFVVPHPY